MDTFETTPDDFNEDIDDAELGNVDDEDLEDLDDLLDDEGEDDDEDLGETFDG
jgi:hypothetical protein